MVLLVRGRSKVLRNLCPPLRLRFSRLLPPCYQAGLSATTSADVIRLLVPIAWGVSVRWGSLRLSLARFGTRGERLESSRHRTFFRRRTGPKHPADEGGVTTSKWRGSTDTPARGLGESRVGSHWCALRYGSGHG
jgi:hypothetical protein